MSPRTRRVAGYVGLALLAYLVFVLARFPASAAYALLQQRPAGLPIQAGQVDGTLWSGRAQAVRTPAAPLGDVRWQLRPAALLVGRLSLDWSVRGGEHNGRGRLSLRPGGALHLEDSRMQLAATELTPLYANLPLRLTGQVNVAVKRLDVDPGRRFTAVGTVDWKDAALTAPQDMQIGSLRITSEADGDGSKLVLEDRGGPLALNGVITIAADGSYRTNLTMAARESADPALVSSLRFFGRPDSQGRVRVTQRGRIPGWPRRAAE